MSARSFVQTLAAVWGGTWQYRGHQWQCDNGLHWVARVSNGVDECDTPYPGHRLVLYGPNQAIELGRDGRPLWPVKVQRIA
jgi:hypothetical protein